MDTLPDNPADIYPGSPLPPIERPVSPLTEVIGPMRLGFPELRLGADFAFTTISIIQEQNLVVLPNVI